MRRLMNDFTDLNATGTRYVRANIKSLAYRYNVHESYLHNAELSTVREEALNMLVTQMCVKLATNKISEEVTDKVVREYDDYVFTKIPRNFFESFKLYIFTESIFRFLFPDYVVDTWVKYKDVCVTQKVREVTRITNHYHACPAPDNAGSCATFLTWGEPFMGTFDEYKAMKEIADSIQIDDLNPMSHSAHKIANLVMRYRAELNARH